MNLIIQLLIGAAAGWLGSELFKGRSLGLIGNIILGIVGSVVGSWIFAKLNFSFGAGVIGMILTGAIGAIVILALINLIFKGR